MSDETIDDLCKDCGPTLTAFLEQMAAHNKEQIGELTPLGQMVPGDHGHLKFNVLYPPKDANAKPVYPRP